MRHSCCSRCLFSRCIYFVLCLLLMAASGARAQTAVQKKQTVDYLQSLETPKGGFAPTKANATDQQRSASSLSATVVALRALKYFGGAARDRQACMAFVDQCFDKKAGSFGDQPGSRSDTITTASGILAIVELNMPLETYRDAALKYLGSQAKTFEEIRMAAAAVESIQQKPPQATAWLELLAKIRNSDGSYGKGDGMARDTGGGVATFLRLGGKLGDKTPILKTLRSGQRADGGFGKAGLRGSDLETTYRVIRTFHMLHDKPTNVAGCQAFIARCRNADGGYGVIPGQKSTAYATYFAAIVLHWLQEK